MSSITYYLSKVRWLGGGLLVLLVSFGLILPASAATTPLEAEVAGDHGWTKTATKKPGDSLEYLMTYRNTTNKVQRHISVKANLPENTVTDKSFIRLSDPNGTAKFGIMGSDDTSGKLGPLKPGEVAYLQYEDLTVPSADTLRCGTNTLRNQMVATVAQTGQQYSATATVIVRKVCQPPPTPTPASHPNPAPTPPPRPAPTPTKPVYHCDTFVPTEGSGGYVAISDFQYTANNVTTYQGAVIDWGDGSHTTLQQDLQLESHTYKKNGRYPVTATLYFMVNNSTGQRTATCSSTVMVNSVQPVTAPVTHTQQPQGTVAAATTTRSTPPPPAPAATQPATATTAAYTSTTPTNATPVAAQTDGKSATPDTLPNTGAGNPITVFGVAVVLGVLSYHFWLRRPLRS